MYINQEHLADRLRSCELMSSKSAPCAQKTTNGPSWSPASDSSSPASATDPCGAAKDTIPSIGAECYSGGVCGGALMFLIGGG